MRSLTLELLPFRKAGAKIYFSNVQKQILDNKNCARRVSLFSPYQFCVDYQTNANVRLELKTDLCSYAADAPIVAVLHDIGEGRVDARTLVEAEVATEIGTHVETIAVDERVAGTAMEGDTVLFKMLYFRSVKGVRLK